MWAKTPERLYALAAEALLAQVVHIPPQIAPEPAAPDRSTRIEVVLEGDDPEDLLVHWLNTALLKAELEHAVWSRVQVKSLSGRRLEAALEGERFDPGRHQPLREVKAVSFHDLALTLDPGDCRCRVILDI